MFVLSRGINAVVSTLQTLTVTGGVVVAGGQISPGELLDPINDTVERFSDVMTYAIGSIFLQKILLVISTNKVFSAFLTLFGVIFIFLVLKKTGNSSVESSTSNVVIKLFILFVVIRFSLGVAILLNTTVIDVFLSDQIETSTSELNNFKSNLDKIKNENKLSEKERSKIQASIKKDKSIMEKIETNDIPELNKALAEVDKKFSHTNDFLKMIKKLDMNTVAKYFNITMDEDQQLKLAIENVSRLERERKSIQKQIKENRPVMERLVEKLKTKDIPDLKNSLAQVDKKLSTAEKNLEPLKSNRDWTSKLNPFNDNPKIDKAGEIVSRLESEKEALEKQIEDKNSLMQVTITKLESKEFPDLIEAEKNLEEAKSNLEKIKLDQKRAAKLSQEYETFARLDRKKDEIDNKIKQKQDEVDKLLESINSNKSRLSGETGWVTSGINKVTSMIPSSSKIQDVTLNTGKIFDNFIRLSVIFILTTIVFPVLFLYLFLYLAKLAWKTDWLQLLEDQAPHDPDGSTVNS